MLQKSIFICPSLSSCRATHPLAPSSRLGKQLVYDDDPPPPPHIVVNGKSEKLSTAGILTLLEMVGKFEEDSTRHFG